MRPSTVEITRSSLAPSGSSRDARITSSSPAQCWNPMSRPSSARHKTRLVPPSTGIVRSRDGAGDDCVEKRRYISRVPSSEKCECATQPGGSPESSGPVMRRRRVDPDLEQRQFSLIDVPSTAGRLGMARRARRDWSLERFGARRAVRCPSASCTSPEGSTFARERQPQPDGDGL